MEIIFYSKVYLVANNHDIATLKSEEKALLREYCRRSGTAKEWNLKGC